jgi:hypothetical protein
VPIDKQFIFVQEELASCSEVLVMATVETCELEKLFLNKNELCFVDRPMQWNRAGSPPEIYPRYAAPSRPIPPPFPSSSKLLGKHEQPNLPLNTFLLNLSP